MLRLHAHTRTSAFPARLAYRYAEGQSDIAPWLKGYSELMNGDDRRERALEARCPNASPECACLRQAIRALGRELLAEAGRPVEATTVIAAPTGAQPVQDYYLPRVIDRIFQDPADAVLAHRLVDVDIADAVTIPEQDLLRFRSRLRLAICAAEHIRKSRQVGQRDVLFANSLAMIDSWVDVALEYRIMFPQLLSAKPAASLSDAMPPTYFQCSQPQAA